MHKFVILKPAEGENDSDAEPRDRNVSVALIDTSSGKPLDELLNMCGKLPLMKVTALVEITKTVVGGNYYESGLYLRIVTRAKSHPEGARNAYLKALDGFLQAPSTLLDVEQIAEEIANALRQSLLRH